MAKALPKYHKETEQKKSTGKFFEFHQNNSGGSFDSDKNVAEVVIIEADNSDEANMIAERIGIYFDGCDDGRDCSCCGDRWYATSDKGTNKPQVYGKPAEDYGSPWMKNPVRIHYKCGTVKKCGKTSKD